MSDYMKKRLFDIDKLSVILLYPLPIEITEGLILEDSFLTIEKANKELVKHKVGLGGEVLINENFDPVHYLTLNYLPSAPAVVELGLLQKAKTQFGVVIQNNSAPKYKGVASECRILNKPDVSIGTIGFKDSVFKILMTDYIETYGV